MGFPDDCPLKLPEEGPFSLCSVRYSVGDTAGKIHRETHSIFLPKPTSPPKKSCVFGLKTDWLYHQPGPWVKSFPLKLNKQPQALLTPCSQLLKPTGAYLGPALHPGPVQTPFSVRPALSP